MFYYLVDRILCSIETDNCTICTNHPDSTTNFYFNTKDERVLLTNEIDNPYWMNNFGHVL